MLACVLDPNDMLVTALDWMVVPRLYYVCESELSDEVVTVGSVVTVKELKMEPMNEGVPFLWAQALYLVARLTRELISMCYIYVALGFNPVQAITNSFVIIVRLCGYQYNHYAWLHEIVGHPSLFSYFHSL